MKPRYYDKELELDGTSEELFIQARNNYIDSPQALLKIEEILRNEVPVLERTGEDTSENLKRAELVHFMAQREMDTNTDFSINQMKIDFINGGCGGGLDDFNLRDDGTLRLSVMFEPANSSVIISLREYGEERDSTGAASISLDEFKAWDRTDFDNFVSSIFHYNMVEEN